MEEDNKSKGSGEEPKFRRSLSMANLFKSISDSGLISNEPQKNLDSLLQEYLPTDVKSILTQIANHVEYTLACQRNEVNKNILYRATAFSLRDRMIEFWNDTQASYKDSKLRRMYYMSIEYLMGRSLLNSVINLGLKNRYESAIRAINEKNQVLSLEDLYQIEEDAALGNGGLGRLASCFLDSLATQNYPAWGYGIRYQYGMFNQKIVNGQQVEAPELWLELGNPWEIPRNDVNYEVRFGGTTVTVIDANKNLKVRWDGGSTVRAIAYDVPIPGYNTMNTINLRLWSSKPSKEFDLDQLNRDENYADYWQNIHNRQKDENICKVLYPQNTTLKGQELRFKQEYFFSSATLQDILNRFKEMNEESPLPISKFPDYNCIQLNDTHPTISILELMRILIDIEGIGWDEAWEITTKTFSFTNHTVLPEALETWPVPFFENLLPRHLEIVYEINERFLTSVRKEYEVSDEIIRSISIIEESHPKRIRMANLAIIGSNKVNGVAKIHTEILKNEVFRDFYRIWPGKFLNITNGVTPRRWLLLCNPRLAGFITRILGDSSWISDFQKISPIKEILTPVQEEEFANIKLDNKRKLCHYIKTLTDRFDPDPYALFDVQIKRIHEYKRQLLNILGVIHRYRELKSMSREERRTCVRRLSIFAGKAAPGYEAAKLIIKLICAVADVINNDKSIDDLLHVIFIPNYSVSLAELIIPANDISEHISTVGTEASGTSNMKFVMNGGLIIGTMDGATIEIVEEVKKQNNDKDIMFIFGATKEEVDDVHRQGKRIIDERLYHVLKDISDGEFGSHEQFNYLIRSIYEGNDYFAVAYDFPGYIDAQQEVDRVWRDRNEWIRRTIQATASMGKFSCDRTIQEYVDNIWKLEKHEPRPLNIEEYKEYKEILKSKSPNKNEDYSEILKSISPIINC